MGRVFGRNALVAVNTCSLARVVSSRHGFS
ncbi:MAG: cytochrome b6-f complex subunit PetN [Pirellulales bacterium]